MSPIPKSGKRARGKIAVTATGTASVHHQIAIHTPEPTVRHAKSDMPSGCGSNMIIIPMKGPIQSPTFWYPIFIGLLFFPYH